MPELSAASPVNESTKDKDKEQMPTMGFLDHLEELRKRIVYSIVAVIVGFFACWFSAPRLVGIMQRPIIEVLHKYNLPEKLVYLNPVDPFNLYLKVAGVAGLFFTSPFVLYQVWCSSRPASTAMRNATSCPSCFERDPFSRRRIFGYRVVIPKRSTSSSSSANSFSR